MARKPRLHYPGAVYHVMLRGNAGQAIFFAPEDYTYLYRLLAEGRDRYGHRIHAFCCMTNHIHLVLQVAEAPLARIMQNLAFRYSRWVNQRQGRTGHLFQGRYKALLVDADSYLVTLTRYIHLHPVRAALVPHPEDYPWSGHRAYIGNASVSWLTTDWVLSQFSSHLNIARQGYRAFVEAGGTEGHRHEFHRGPQDGRLLGDDTFLEQALKWSGQPTTYLVSVAHILSTVCQAYDMRLSEVIALGKARRASEARATMAWLVRELPHVTLADLSTHLGRDLTTLSAAATRLQQRAGTDIALAQQLARIKQSVLNIP